MIVLPFLFLFGFCHGLPGYTASGYSENDIGHGTTSGGSAYGYAGSTSGSGYPVGGVPAYPGYVPFYPQFDFSFFFEQLNKQHQDFLRHGGGAFSYSFASSEPGASAKAQSSISSSPTSGDWIQNLARGYAYGAGGYAPNYPGSYYGGSQGGYGGASHGGSAAGGAAGGYGGSFGLGNRGGFSGGYGGGYSGPEGTYSFSGPFGADANGAYASGSIGPGGAHQTAAVYPENPTSPNVNTRFGGASSGNGGFKSVSTSSHSVTSNVNGRPQTFKQASSTINDNGRVTTYSAHNP